MFSFFNLPSIKHFLHDYIEKPKDTQTFLSILSDTVRYFDADRSYLFDVSADRTSAGEIFEWCRDGVTSETERLQKTYVEDLKCWFEVFAEKEEFYISSLSDEYAPHSPAARLL